MKDLSTPDMIAGRAPEVRPSTPSVPPATPSSDQAPAYTLWVELATRITTQPLHYRAGDEEAAARSVSTLFQSTRTLIEANPDAARFRALSLQMINVLLRPYTSRWHGWMTEHETREGADGQAVLVFRDELVRRMFRAELRDLQKALAGYKAEFAGLALIEDANETAPKSTASLGGELVAGIRHQVTIATSPALVGDVALHRINEAERHEIQARRSIRTGQDQHAQPLRNAIGLALSGGGIRSATYCLGIVQVLVRKRLFPQFDYLSTVSGGGYLGTFLSCALGTGAEAEATAGPPKPKTAADLDGRIREVFESQTEGAESGLIRHLRNESKFLLNGGATGKLKIAGMLISGILWNMLMVLPIPLAGAFVVYFFSAHWDLWDGTLYEVDEFDWPSGDAWITMGMTGLLLFTGAAVLLLPFAQAIAHGQKPASIWVVVRRLFVGVALTAGVLAIFAVMLYLQPALFYYYERLRQVLADQGALTERVSGWLAPAAAGTGSMVLGLLATTLKATWPRLKNVAANLFILSGPLFFLCLYLSAGNRLGLGAPHPAWSPLWPAVVATAVLALWSYFVVNINTLSPHDYYRARLCDCYLARRSAAHPHSTLKALWNHVAPKSRQLKTAADEPHPVRTPWRRLLTGEFAQSRTESLQQVPLTELSQHPAAPYHLLNAIVNLPGSDSKELRGRGGDFFMISKHFCGAPIVGYVPTQHLEENDRHFDLGSAMAVSAAAASTSMGWKSLPNFRFLMTMLNVRLGYWLRWDTRVLAPGVRFFLQEMRASMDERGPFLNLSDGGHIENLGAYELLRRRCKFIVCVDGGQEPGMECADLTRLQRYAEIDLGIQFEYGIADLSLQPNGFSRASAILVKIIYSRDAAGEPDELGWMIYLKLAMTGVEPVYVLDYRRENPTFPHESTGDQIYDEAQFEAYRRLGECAAENLFREELFGSDQPKTVHDWFQGLADNLLADNDPVFKNPQAAVVAAGPAEEKKAAAPAAPPTPPQ